VTYSRCSVRLARPIRIALKLLPLALVLGMALPVAAADEQPWTPSEQDQAMFHRLEPQVALAGLRIDDATLEAAMQTLGKVDRKNWLKVDGKPVPYFCYVGPDGTRAALGFRRIKDRVELSRFEILAPGSAMEHRLTYWNDEPNGPKCARVENPPRGTTGGLRLGMTKAQVIALIGEKYGGTELHAWQDSGSPEDFWAYSGVIRAELTPTERDHLSKHGMDPNEYYTSREVRLEFEKNRLVSIRVMQMTSG